MGWNLRIEFDPPDPPERSRPVTQTTSTADSSRALVATRAEEQNIETRIQRITRTGLWGMFTGLMMVDVWALWATATYAPWVFLPVMGTLSIATLSALALLLRGPGSKVDEAIKSRIEEEVKRRAGKPG
jgi:hypothetical protein